MMRGYFMIERTKVFDRKQVGKPQSSIQTPSLQWMMYVHLNLHIMG